MAIVQKETYQVNLQNSELVFALMAGVYAFPDCDSLGGICSRKGSPKFVIVQHVSEGDYLCSCDTHPATDCLHIVVGKC